MFSPGIADAVAQLESAGIAVIAASGNDGKVDEISTPACIDGVLSVGATDDTDFVAVFSNVSDSLDYFAPGVSIDSAVPGGGEANKSGTSMSSPHVAGAWALLRELDSSSTTAALAATLTATGTPVDDSRAICCNESSCDPCTGSALGIPRINLEDALYALPGWVPTPGPLSVQPTTSSGQSYSVSWNPSNPYGTYDIQESMSPLFTSPSQWQVSVPFRSFIHTVAVPTTFYYRARATKPGTSSPWSETASTVVQPNPSALSVTAVLTPSTAEPNQPVTVSGQAVYNTGGNLPAGQVDISAAGQVWTAAINNGSYSRSIQAPTSSSLVTVTATDGLLSGSASAWLNVVNSPTGGGGYTLVNDIATDIWDDGDNAYWFAKDAFRSTDPWVRAINSLTNKTLFEWVSSRARFYYPNGAQYGSTLDNVDFCRPEWDWCYAWNGFQIAGNDMAQTPGQYKVKFYIDDGDGWEYRQSQTFVVGWNMTENRMCGNVGGAPNYNCLSPGNEFLTSSSRAYAWANLDLVAQPLTARWRFYRPDGNLYNSFEFGPTEDPGPDSWWGFYRIWGWIDIAGNDAAQHPGIWEVRVDLRNPVTSAWQQQYTDFFSIVENPPSAPTIAVSGPAGPVFSTTPVSLSINAADNTTLRKVTLYWSTGGAFSQQDYNNIFSGTFSTNKLLGTLPAGTTLEYFARAWDTSDNVAESPHGFLAVNRLCDLSVSLTDTPDPVDPAGTLTYGVATTNSGPDAAVDVAMLLSLPSEATVVSITSPGWTCEQGTAQVNCTRPALPPTSSQITIAVNGPFAGPSLLATASVLTATSETNSANNSAAAPTTVSGGPPTQTVTVTPLDSQAGEPADNGSYRITRSGSTTSSLIVNITMTGTATNGSDYQTISSPRAIPAGAGYVDVPLTIINDSAVEGTETATINLQSGSGYTVGGPSSASISITDDDSAGGALFSSDFESGWFRDWYAGVGMLGSVWHLDEGSGTTAADSFGSDHGTVGGASWTSGHGGAALDFGTPDTSNVMIPRSVYDGFGDSAYVEAWIYPTAYPASGNVGTIFRKRGAFNDWAIELRPDGTLSTYIAGAGGINGTGLGVVSLATVPLNQWTRVASHYDGDELRLLLNDIVVAADTLPLELDWDAPTCPGDQYYDDGCYYGSWIGITSIYSRTSVAPGTRFSGRIDEVLIYSEPISGSGVLAFDPFEDGVISNWTTYGGCWSESDGLFHCSTTPANSAISAIRSDGTSWTNYAVEVDVKPLSTYQPSATGIVFRFESEYPIGQFCDCSLYRYQGTYLSLYCLGGPAHTTPFPFGTTEFYRLRATVSGDLLTCEVVGAPGVSVSGTFPSIPSQGSAGLRSTHIASDFDNFLVTSY